MMMRMMALVVAAVLGASAMPARAATMPGSACSPHFALDEKQAITKGTAKGVIRFGGYENSVASTDTLPVYCPIPTNAATPFIKDATLVIGTQVAVNKAASAECALIFTRNVAGATGWSGASYKATVAAANASGSQLLALSPSQASWPAIAGIVCKLPPGFSITSYRYSE